MSRWFQGTTRRRRVQPAVLGLALMGALTAGPDARSEVEQSEPVVVVPSDALPPEVEPKLSNNNLDVVRHDGRVFLAFRTGKNHFASDETVLHVVSSETMTEWQHEASFARGTDLREPRLLSWDGRLFLYFAVLGTSPIDFEPQGMMVTEYLGPGVWSEPEWFHEPGFIPWRTKVIDDVPYMIAYEGGENIYDPGGEPIEVHWLTTVDGRNWEAAVPGQPVVLRGGSSETDFVLLDDGALIAVSRNEAGDELGWGMKICRAEPESLGQWHCVGDKKKYDSPLLFRHDRRVYLIGRRNVTPSGNYDLGYEWLSPQMRTWIFQYHYWRQPKRCSLWEVSPDTLDVTFVADLPSRGDTCFPGILPPEGREVTVFNYSSPYDDGTDPDWIDGQLGPTLIVRLNLTLPATDEVATR